MYIYQKERKYLDFRSRIHDKFGSIVQVELGTLLTMPPLTKNLLKKCQISYFILCSFGKHFERNKSDQISQKRLIHTSACTNFGICLILWEFLRYSVFTLMVSNWWDILLYHGGLYVSVRPKLGFGIGNRNQDQVSESVSGPELFLPKPKLSIWYRYLEFWMKNENILHLAAVNGHLKLFPIVL